MSQTGKSGPVRHEVEIEVRYAETDQMGVVHHANYLVWLELARTGLCALSGYHYSEIEKLGYFLMVTGVSIEYRQGVRYGDKVKVTAWIERLSSRGLRFAYQILLGDQRAAMATTDHLWIESSSNRPRRTPAELRQAFERLADGSPESTHQPND